MSSDKLYDVVIYENATRVIAAVIGENMRSYDGVGSGRNTAEFRVRTGLERINDRYDCVMVAAGRYKKGDMMP